MQKKGFIQDVYKEIKSNVDILSIIPCDQASVFHLDFPDLKNALALFLDSYFKTFFKYIWKYTNISVKYLFIYIINGFIKHMDL